MDPEALERIAAAVTPAVMVSACGLIALGLDNQAARMAMRLRDLVRELRGLDEEPGRREAVRRQVAILTARHRHYARALTLNYGALLLFVLTSLLYLAQGVLGGATVELALVAFTAGVSLLGVMAVFVLASLRLARSAIELETAGLFEPPPLTPAGAASPRHSPAG